MKTWEKLKEDQKLWQKYFVREKVTKAIRTFFDERGFHEIEIPLLIAHPPAESYLEVFETTLLDGQRHPTKAYLSTSPEVSLKKLMVAGLGNCYSLTKSFRNMETQSKLHNPEFTILEWYRVGADYRNIMKDCEELLTSIKQRLQGHSKPQAKNPAERKQTSKDALRARSFVRESRTQDDEMYGIDDLKIVYQGQTINLKPPWERLTVAESFNRYANVNFDDFLDFKKAKNIAAAKGYRVEPKSTWENLFNQIFLNEVEPKLGQGRPTILYEYPVSMAALAKVKESDKRFAERFEFYINGLELGDAYSELTDWREQERRFKGEIKEINRLGKTVYDYDHDFIGALKAGLPKCSGIAVGVDRLVMLFADADDIHDTLLFPGKEEFGS